MKDLINNCKQPGGLKRILEDNRKVFESMQLTTEQWGTLESALYNGIMTRQLRLAFGDFKKTILTSNH